METLNKKRHTERYSVVADNTKVTTEVYLSNKTVVVTVTDGGTVKVTEEPPPRPLIVVVNN